MNSNSNSLPFESNDCDDYIQQNCYAIPYDSYEEDYQPDYSYSKDNFIEDLVSEAKVKVDSESNKYQNLN